MACTTPYLNHTGGVVLLCGGAQCMCFFIIYIIYNDSCYLYSRIQLISRILGFYCGEPNSLIFVRLEGPQTFGPTGTGSWKDQFEFSEPYTSFTSLSLFD